MPDSCPSCKKPIQSDSSACPYCGEILKTTCPSCGKPLESGWQSCPFCGASILEPSIETQTSRSEKQSDTKTKYLEENAISMPQSIKRHKIHPVYIVCILALSITVAVFIGFVAIRLLNLGSVAPNPVFSNYKQRVSFRVYYPTYLPEGFDYADTQHWGTSPNDGFNVKYRSNKSSTTFYLIEGEDEGGEPECKYIETQLLDNGLTANVWKYNAGGWALWMSENDTALFKITSVSDDLFSPTLDELKKVAASMKEIK